FLADVYTTQNDAPRAEEALKRAAEIDPKAPGPKSVLASFYQRTGKSDRSAAIYEDLIQNDPSNAALKRTLAAIYFGKRAYDRAIKLADELLKANAKDTSARVFKGQVLLAQGKNKESLAELQTAVKNDPSSGFARYSLGTAYLQDGKAAEAETAWTD